MRIFLCFLILMSCILVINADHDGFANLGDDAIQSAQVEESISSTITQLEEVGILPSNVQNKIKS